jgi:hypothetical protein
MAAQGKELIMTPAARPPFWAEPLLRALLPPDRVEDVVGDLLEDVRERPRSAIAAHVWWAGCAVGLFLRTFWVFPLLLAAAGVIGDLFNTFGDVHPTSSLHGIPIFTTFGAAGLYGGFRTRRVSGGLVGAVGSHLTSWTAMTLWWTLTTYPFAFRQQQSPYWINAWHWSAAPGESFMHWILWDNVGAVVLGGLAFLLLSTVLGLVAGVIGSGLGRRHRPVSA